MKTTHDIVFQNANDMSTLKAKSIALVVTSPPYPMIEMWDDLFCKQDAAIRRLIDRPHIPTDGPAAFERMHVLLDEVWRELYRVIMPGGIACINIGDATRTLGDNFALYTNHQRIIQKMTALGFSALPLIIWRKQTNAPNKFMGSGMLPPGAYVTLEHEYVLIFRKGGKREFKSVDKKMNRRRSAYFWEERNQWFSDVWFDLKGTPQQMLSKEVRDRSGAFPFELPYRLIQMFSVLGDTVLDPFAGIGTTACAAVATGRNSVGYELEAGFRDAIAERMAKMPDQAEVVLQNRITNHEKFVAGSIEAGKPLKYTSTAHGFPIITRQEVEMTLQRLLYVERTGDDSFEAQYATYSAESPEKMTDKEATRDETPKDAEIATVKHRAKDDERKACESQDFRKDSGQLGLFG